MAAKHGAVGLVKTLALEGAEHEISATAVCPGYVRTPLVEGQIASQAEATGRRSEVLEEVILEPHAVKRLIEPGEVAEVVRFLIERRRAAFTGSPVAMDHGLDRAIAATRGSPAFSLPAHKLIVFKLRLEVQIASPCCITTLDSSMPQGPPPSGGQQGTCPGSRRLGR